MTTPIFQQVFQQYGLAVVFFFAIVSVWLSEEELEREEVHHEEYVDWVLRHVVIVGVDPDHLPLAPLLPGASNVCFDVSE